MKKLLPVLAAIIILGGGVFLLTKSDKEAPAKNQTNESTSTSAETQAFSPPKACEAFTLEDAKKVLGDSAEKTELPGGGGASSDDIDVSQCIYSQPGGDTLASIKTQKQASLLVRGAKTKKGADSNKDVFTGSLKPAEAQDVSGYGDVAYWNPQFGQLNVFKNGNWYIISAGVSTPAEKTLEESKALADVLISKL